MQNEDMNRWGMPGSGQSLTASTTPSSLSSSSIKTTNSATATEILSKSDTSNTPKSDLPSNSPTDSENNNQPLGGRLSDSPQFLQPTPTNKSLSVLSNSTVSAAADSSDNQPPTPQPTGATSVLGVSGGGLVESVYSNSPLAYQPLGSQPILGQEMHHYPTYMHGYDQYYHPPPPNMDYATQSAIYASQQQGPPGNQEYKIVPSSRYHPYMNNSGNLHPHHSTNGNASNNASSSASNSSLSPRVVSSSSPTQNAIMGPSSQDSMSSIQQQSEQASSVGPKICDKCGVVCQTHAHLTEHYNTAHGTQPPNDRSGEDQQSLETQYPYQPYIKEEPPSDILDLDSQKMVYPPQHDGSTIVGQEPLPPMHSMHPMHRSLVWGAGPDIHSGYMPHPQPPDIKPYYPQLKQNYVSIKQEYPGTVVPGFNTTQAIKSEFSSHPHQNTAVQPRDLKPFNTEMNSSGSNPVTSSPSEFPSTTTPQENGGQYRGFEPPTSSLPSNAPVTKSSTWKSNEARRPKTYNCTACNKWFTSSGHLKRHYNTTLHKNAVKSSGQPDPATLPISAHHHPSRDPNSKHHHHRNSQANQPPPAPPEPPRSPDYTPQYTPPPNSYNQPQQGFQQYTNIQQSSQSTNGHPNGQAGPSVRASLQQRGLLIISNTATTSSLEAQQEQEEQIHLQHQQLHPEEEQDPYINLQQQVQQQQQQEETEQDQLQQQAINTRNLELHQAQQRQSQGVHIISMSPQVQQHMLQQQLQEEPIISTMGTTPTTTTIINTMDQEFIITSPLAINTNITQSYQPLQHQGEHQLNYPTITGNEVSNDQMITSSDMSNAEQQLFELTTYGLDNQAQHHEIVAVQRLPSGLVSYQDSMSLPYTPIVPESCIYATQVKCERSPEVGDVAPEISPYSPTITSTKAAYPSPPETASATISGGGTKRISSGSIKRRKSDKKPPQDIQNQLERTMGGNTNLSSALSIEIPTVPVLNSLGTPTGEIRCDECNKVFTKICYLTQHNKTFHNGEQPFRCNRCGKRFSNEVTFDTHYAKHSAAQKPHQCQFCPKQFHHKTDLRRHIDSHTGRKAYVCETCSKGFTRRDHLRKHGDTHKPKPPKPLKIRTVKVES